MYRYLTDSGKNATVRSTDYNSTTVLRAQSINAVLTLITAV